MIDFNNVMLMKFGTHGNASPHQIILDKTSDLLASGVFFWGYGGSTCHPENQVQPFLNQVAKNGENVYLVLSPIASVWDGNASQRSLFSRNFEDWIRLPDGVTVSGSKYAVICDEITICEEVIDLSNYEVSVGPHAGRPVSSYLRGRNTKACASRSKNAPVSANKFLRVQAFCRIVDAVYLK